MPKLSSPLTDKEIRALKPKQKIYKKSDGDKLYISVTPQGKKIFFMEYLNPLTNKITRKTIGYYPEVSLKEARDIKDKIKRNSKENKPKSITFKEAALEWWKIKEQRVTKEYFKRQCRYIEIYIFPFLAERDINTITTKEVLHVIDKLQEKNIYETQKRVFLMTREILSFARQKGYTEQNVLSDVNYSKVFIISTVKHYATLTEPKDIKGLLMSINEYDGNWTTKYAMLLAIYTAQRPFNVRSAEWSEFDLENALWAIPAKKMKMKEKHLVPLSSQTIELIKKYRDLGIRSKFLFPSIKNSNIQMSDNTINSALRRMGYTRDEIVGHGFRAMFSTIANENREEHKLSHDIIELCLAHKERNSVRRAYNHAENLGERATLMQWWSDYLERLLK